MEENKDLRQDNAISDDALENVSAGGIKEVWDAVSDFAENAVEKISDVVEDAADVLRFIKEVKK